MTETEARDALLVRAFETAPPGQANWSDDDRAWASRAAAEVEGASATSERFVARRAALAAERLAKRERSVRNALRASSWRPWIGWAVPLLALVAGLLTDAVGPSKHVNVLAPPLLALMAWNVLAYASIALRAVIRRPGRAPRPGALGRMIARAAQRTIEQERTGARSPATARFAGDWTRASARLTATRAARILHVSAIAFALGALAGLYVRGLAFEFRAGWESTFLDAETLHAMLGFILRPASVLAGIELPDVARLEAMRFPESAGERAAPWIHLYAVTVALVVLVPRALLAMLDRAIEHRLARSFPLPMSDPYFAALVREHSGEAVHVLVLPCHFAPSPKATLTVQAMLGGVFGTTLRLVVGEPVAYGDEEAVDRRVASAAGLTLLVALFSSSATPERETHGLFLERLLAARDPASAVLALVDESAFAARFGGDDPTSSRRRDERRVAWKRLLGAHELQPMFVDLERADAAESSRRLREALGRRAATADAAPA